MCGVLDTHVQVYVQQPDGLLSKNRLAYICKKHTHTPFTPPPDCFWPIYIISLVATIIPLYALIAYAHLCAYIRT